MKKIYTIHPLIIKLLSIVLYALAGFALIFDMATFTVNALAGIVVLLIPCYLFYTAYKFWKIAKAKEKGTVIVDNKNMFQAANSAFKKNPIKFCFISLVLAFCFVVCTVMLNSSENDIPAPTATPIITVTPSNKPTVTPTVTPTPIATPTVAPTAIPTVAPTKEPIAQINEEPETTSTTVYITETGKAYHYSGCSSLKKSKIAISLDKAESQGYKPCQKCH